MTFRRSTENPGVKWDSMRLPIIAAETVSSKTRQFPASDDWQTHRVPFHARIFRRAAKCHLQGASTLLGLRFGRGLARPQAFGRPRASSPLLPRRSRAEGDLTPWGDRK